MGGGAVTTQTISLPGAGIPAGDLADLIADKEHWQQWLSWDLPELRDESRNWRLWDPGLTGTERECQDKAVAECQAALEAVTAEIAALEKQAAATGEAATERPENGERE
jgi:hypothetical protein